MKIKIHKNTEIDKLSGTFLFSWLTTNKLHRISYLPFVYINMAFEEAFSDLSVVANVERTPLKGRLNQKPSSSSTLPGSI